MSFRSLNIGMTGLMTNQLALNTTGHNVANAVTPGFSRQRVITTNNRPQVYPYGAVGTGVGVKSIESVVDNFLEIQVRTATSTYGSLNAKLSGYENLEAYFNELTGNDISTTFNNFWNALSDFNNKIENLSIRSNLTSVAETFCDTIKSVREKIYSYRTQQNNAVRDTVGQVNQLTTQVANLNAAIMKAECGGALGIKANDLRDQRTELLKKLSEIMDVSITEETNGSTTVAQKGRLLVYQNQTFELETTRKEVGDLLVDQVVFAADKQIVNLGTGKLAGMVAMRDEIALTFQKELDQFAGEFIWNFNRQFSQGVGLEGFDQLTATNRVMDPTVTLDKLQYDFSPMPGTFQIKDGSFQIIVYDQASQTEKRVTIDINLTDPNEDKKTILFSKDAVEGPPGVWTFRQPENSLVRKIQDALDAVTPGTFTVEIDQLNRISLKSNADGTQFAFGEDTSGVLAALGLNTLFTGNNAQTIGVNQTFVDNPQLLAGADNFTAGNQKNAQVLNDLRLKSTMKNGTSTFESYYQGVVGRLGIEASKTQLMYAMQVDIKISIENQRESLSGVNLDEEMIKMTQYQNSYSASAQFISVVQTMYDTLLAMVN